MYNQSLKFSGYVLIATLNAACTHPIHMVGAAVDPVEAEDVRLYYRQRPLCEFETIGYLRIEGGHYSINSLFNTMRQQAAMVGANGLYVTETHRLDVFEYTGVAKAIRCLAN